MTSPCPHLVLLGGAGGRSGVPRHIEQICRVLMSEKTPRYRITVISEPDAGGYDFAGDLGVALTELPALASSTNPVRALIGLRALRGALNQDPPDLVWAHARLPVLMSRLLPRGDTPLIVTFHGSPFLGRRPANALLMRGIESVLMRLARSHEVVFLSETDRQSFNGLPHGRHRSRIIPNVAAEIDFPPVAPARDLTLVMATRDSPQKNPEAAARIFAHLPDNTRLVLLGMGTDSPALKTRFAAILPPSALSRVSFRGQVADIAPELRRAHGYLMTSRYEGMSLGALEAFAAGLPVFQTDVAGSQEILTAHPLAAIIDPAAPQEAANVILPILKSYQAAPHQHSAANSAAYHARFSSADWAREIRALLSDALTGQPPEKPLD